MLLIVFEGIDGTGKTTLINNLAQTLKTIQPNSKVIIINGLGSTNIGTSIREMFLFNPKMISETRYFLSFANLIQIQNELIKPHLKTNTIILMDRYLGSNFAYQAYPFQIDPHYSIFQLIQKKFLKPQITVLIDLEPKIALKRKGDLIDLIENQPLSYFQQVVKGYQLFFNHYLKTDYKIKLNGLNSTLQHQTVIFNYLDLIKSLN
ncbi:Thymidylate kinase [Candidatus Phytoplasma mali]|uniref:Thymidylate kinase n=1 Tax=Phytoplasma mali (strain AT) TaxID=482235 RepID=B3QZI3_PHYMT|nr:dTMP kinase [Candidatus Phytoplasma mali]CAP18590.1 Thymidylate kinase [Candidatus Phytoplasma mali]